MGQFFSFLAAIVIVVVLAGLWAFLWLLGVTLNHIYRLWENIT